MSSRPSVMLPGRRVHPIGYEDAPTGMLQVAHEFEFTRYHFDYILQKPGLNRNSKKPIPAMLSTNYKDSPPVGYPPLSLNGRITGRSELCGSHHHDA